MNNFHLHFLLFIFLIYDKCSLIESQQLYIRMASDKCDSIDNSTSVLGYTCNGVSSSCQSYLTFRSLPPFNSVSSISSLLLADPSQVSQLNNVSRDAVFETNTIVIVPVNCSCSDRWSQYNTSYAIRHENTYFSIANSTYQGLSSCQALQAQNPNLSSRNLTDGTRIIVPLRCACPTKNQTDDGVKYLLSYLVTWGQSVSVISSIFGVETEKTLLANGLSDKDFTIYPFTTLLVPLQNPPSISQIVAPPPPPQSQQTPPTSVSRSRKSSSNRTWVYALVGTLAGAALLSVSGLFAFWFCFRRRKNKEKDSVIVSESFESIEKPFWKGINLDDEEISQSFRDSISSFAQSLNLYTYKELKLATDNFSPSCLIGGSVYRGMINGDYAAIKKISGDVSKEINLLNKINHLNLIRLSGVCFNDGYWYLVFEYAANGALSDWIYRNQRKEEEKVLNWEQRMQIGLDVAAGLNYLHSYTSPPHVHKDLKCSNILLDGDFRAKISNFGLARSADADGGQFGLTRHIIGTKGYMAPEYLENGQVSTMLDVYSFGVLLLEILTGKEVAVLYESVNLQLTEILSPVINEKVGIENLSRILDSSLGGNYPSEVAILVIRLIDSCLKKDPSARPNMHDIVQTLSIITKDYFDYSNNYGVII